MRCGRARAQDLPLATPYEALILASIVEKETGRRRRARTHRRRVRAPAEAHMLLQTDPTVIYGMGAAYAGNIRKSRPHDRHAVQHLYPRRACRRRRSRCRASRPCWRRCIRPPAPSCISSRAAMAAMCLPARWTSTTAMSTAISGSVADERHRLASAPVSVRSQRTRKVHQRSKAARAPARAPCWRGLRAAIERAGHAMWCKRASPAAPRWAKRCGRSCWTRPTSGWPRRPSCC